MVEGVRWTAKLRKGSIQLCLLALLSQDRKYGFQIIKELTDGYIDLKEGPCTLPSIDLKNRGI